MKFEDATLVKLATPAARDALFDATALEQFVAALYDTSFVTVQAPFQALFDDLQLGLAVPRTGFAEGEWAPLGSSDKTALHVRLSGVGGGPIQVDAFWRGFIVARTTHPAGRIRSVTTALPDPAAIDADIVQALGALPAGAALEAERRKRLAQALQNAVADPNVVTAAEVDRLISRAGAATVSEYFDRVRGAATIGAVKVVIDEPAPPPVSPRPLPVAAAILVRDATVSIRALLADSRAVRDQLENTGLGAPEGGLRRRRDLLVIWVLPAAVFDDADWPGGQPGAPPNALRDARRAAAGEWLAGQGIGLAAVG